MSGCHAIMKNGGALCKSGGLLLAIAAQCFSVPFIIVSAMYKLTPKFPINQSTFNELVSFILSYILNYLLRKIQESLFRGKMVTEMIS